MKTRWLILMACAALAGCAETEQTAGTRKADVDPMQGPAQGALPAYTAAGWKAGDATSWESQMKSRTQHGQNEYSRIGTH